MLINSTQRQVLIKDGVATNYVVAHQLPNDTLAAEGNDQIDILTRSGALLHSSPGRNLETNIQGDVFWTEDRSIQKWTQETGESTLAEGYSSFIPGPAGKVFAIGYDKEVKRATVDLLSPEGNLLSKATLPDRFQITGAYINRDQSKALLGGWSEAYTDVYSRTASLFSLEVGENDELKMTTERRDGLNALSQKDYQPFLLEDGRVGVATQATVRIGTRVAKEENAWNLIGSSAAPGGRPVDVSGTGQPAVTLSEQLNQMVYTFREPNPRHYREEGTPLWPVMQPPNPNLVDRTPAPIEIPAPPVEKKEKGFFSRALHKVFSPDEEASAKSAPSFAESTPRFVDPSLAANLRETLGLSGLAPQSFPKAELSQSGDSVVIHFHTGFVLSKTGSGEKTELNLYGPTGDQKELPARKTFSFDAESGVLTVDNTSYGLKDGKIQNEWVEIDNGTIQAKTENLAYLGNGKFKSGADSYRPFKELPLHPEIFNESVGYEKKHGSGEIFTQSEVLIASCPSFRSVEKVETFKAPEYQADESLNASENKLLKSHFRVTFPDARVLEGDAKSVTLDGKELKNSKLLVSDDIVTLRRESMGTSLTHKASDSFWNAVGNIITPGTRKYDVVEGREHVVSYRDITISPDGKVTVSDFSREGRFESDPIVKVSEQSKKLGDWEVGNSFERLLDPDSQH